MKDWLEIAGILVADFKRKNCHKFTLGDRLPKNEQRTILLIKCRNGRRRARRRDMCVNHYNRECSYHLTELVTGHRGYYKYLDRIGYDDSSICPTCPGEEEDAIFLQLFHGVEDQYFASASPGRGSTYYSWKTDGKKQRKGKSKR